MLVYFNTAEWFTNDICKDSTTVENSCSASYRASLALYWKSNVCTVNSTQTASADWLQISSEKFWLLQRQAHTRNQYWTETGCQNSDRLSPLRPGTVPRLRLRSAMEDLLADDRPTDFCDNDFQYILDTGVFKNVVCTLYYITNSYMFFDPGIRDIPTSFDSI